MSFADRRTLLPPDAYLGRRIHPRNNRTLAKPRRQLIVVDAVCEQHVVLVRGERALDEVARPSISVKDRSAPSCGASAHLQLLVCLG